MILNYYIVQAVQEELASHQHLVDEVNQLSQDFEPQTGERAAGIGIEWTTLETSLERLRDCYGHAAADWIGIESHLDDIQQWCSDKIEWSRRFVEPGKETETLAQIQVWNE